MGGTAYTGSRPGYVYTTRHGVTDYYPDANAARPSLLTRLASWRGTSNDVVVAEPIDEEDDVAALRQRIASMQAQLAEEEAAEAREKEASERSAAEVKAQLEAEQRALEEEHARERRELAEKQRALAAEHAAEKKLLAAKKAEAEARAREVEAEARRAREAAEAKAREEADGTYAAGPFLDGTYVKGCAEINQ